MSLTLNHSVIMKFHIIKTKTILIRKINYSEYCLNTEAGNIYKINIYISTHLNRADIIKILNIHQKLFILKKNNIIIYNTIDNIIYDI